jgi:hypothetical protein
MSNFVQVNSGDERSTEDEQVTNAEFHGGTR